MEHQILEAADFSLHHGDVQGIWAQCLNQIIPNTIKHQIVHMNGVKAHF